MRKIPLLLAFLPLVAGCADEVTAPDAVDLDALFAPPTQAEIETILAEWQARAALDPPAPAFVAEQAVQLGGAASTLTVVSHPAGSAGERTYGIIIEPDGAPAASLPILLYAHGGDGGVSADEVLFVADAVLGGAAADYVIVAPAFRAEPLRLADDVVFESAAEPSPWDRDVDDALALIASAPQLAPAADPTRVGVLGFSRGGGVGLIMGVRDAGVDVIVDFFGPTDFFDDFVREIVEEILAGEFRDLPGLDYLAETYVLPLAAGALSIEEVRLEMLRRSPVYFAERLPDVQAHHGERDPIVSVSQALRLAEVMQALGREPPRFELHLYELGGHHPLTLEGSLERAALYLERLQSIAASRVAASLP